MKTTRSKQHESDEPTLTAIQKAVLESATPEQLRAMRASINARLRKHFGGGRPRKTKNN